MFLREVDECEVRETVRNCKNKRSVDVHGIDMALLKETIECVIKPLTYICNASFKAGIFPEQMKIAKVLPLFKAGDKKELSNYRPVSILPQFSKILEKLFVKRLDSFIGKFNILTENQYGFRINQSTGLALMKLVEEITSAIDKRKFFWDFYRFKKGL